MTVCLQTSIIVATETQAMGGVTGEGIVNVQPLVSGGLALAWLPQSSGHYS